jgi:outer membrane murein-binding lipoprotein Lpp
MKCGKSVCRLFLRRSLFIRALLPVLLLTLMPMVLLSQNSDPKSNNSSATFKIWQQISARFQTELTALRKDLQAALSDAQQSKTSLQKWTDLYETSLTRITNLETFNEQIGQRMQESDEWNAELQDEQVKLKADIKVSKAHGLRNTIIAGIAGLALGLLIPLVIKLLRTFTVIPV